MNNMIIHGMQVVENINMTVDGEPVFVKRTWIERLFSLPWSPLRKMNKKIPQVPSTEVICSENKWIMHPETAKKIKEAIKQQEEILNGNNWKRRYISRSSSGFNKFIW